MEQLSGAIFCINKSRLRRAQSRRRESDSGQAKEHRSEPLTQGNTSLLCDFSVPFVSAVYPRLPNVSKLIRAACTAAAD